MTTPAGLPDGCRYLAGTVLDSRGVLRTLVAEELPERAKRAGGRLRAGVREPDLLRAGDVRRHGLAIGVELVTVADSAGW